MDLRSSRSIVGLLYSRAAAHKWCYRTYSPTCALGRRTDLGFMVAERVGGSADSAMVKGAREQENEEEKQTLKARIVGNKE